MGDRAIVIVDGENLVIRFQEMAVNRNIQNEAVTHIKDCFVWSTRILNRIVVDSIVHVDYYTLVIGDSIKIDKVKNSISTTEFSYLKDGIGGMQRGTLVPHVFKKESKQIKTKSVDINLTVDALRHAYFNSIDYFILLTGDGDYIPLVDEIMRRGKRVKIGSFSSGLNNKLKVSADDHFLLDRYFFE